LIELHLHFESSQVLTSPATTFLEHQTNKQTNQNKTRKAAAK